MTVFDLPGVEALIQSALAEDLGRGDLTTRLTVDPGAQASGEIVAKQEGVVAGLPLVERIFRLIDPGRVSVEAVLQDGAELAAGAVVATLSGPAAALLAGERVALNFLQHLCGVATLTRQYVRAIAGTRARLVDTRKTLPGLRVLDKYAVRVGGGHNHRMGLDDGILIKDNHIAAAGGVSNAVRSARAGAPHTTTVEVECTNLAEVDEALAAGAAVVLLDNMTVDELRAAVRYINGRVLIEASGGVTLANIRAVADTGVDLISVGALTHSAPAVDLSMRMRLSH
jgi:nicotinate-nucleotide pyrophosphorylase (carboxylating)